MTSNTLPPRAPRTPGRLRDRQPRGVSFVTVLILLGLGAGVWWVASYGEAYWDNLEVKSAMTQATNIAYHEPDDARVRHFVMDRLHEMFDIEVEERGVRKKVLKINLEPDDLRVERTKVPAYINIWLTYDRPVKLFLTGKERVLTFSLHAQQDLSPVVWK